MDDSEGVREGKSPKSLMQYSEREGSDLFLVFQQLAVKYQNLPAPTQISLLRQTRDIKNEWCFFLMKSPPSVTISSRLFLVFSMLENSDRSPICMPLRAPDQAQPSPGECPLDLIAVGILQFFISGTAKVFYETEEPFAPFSLSCSDETLAGLLTVLFFKVGLTKDRCINISSPRVSLNCLVRGPAETILGAWDQNRQVKELKQLLICASCLKLFTPILQGHRCEHCGYRSYCSQQCKEFQWSSTKTHLPTHQSECKTIHDLLDELGQKRLLENYIYLGEDEFKIKFPPRIPSILTAFLSEDTFDYLFPLSSPGASPSKDKVEEKPTGGNSKIHKTNCEKRWLKALEDLNATEEDFSNLWESPDPDAPNMYRFPIELFLVKS